MNKTVINELIQKAAMRFTAPQKNYEFLVDTINMAGTLAKLPYELKSVPSGNLDALTFRTHVLRARDKNSFSIPEGTNNVTERQIPFAVKDMDFDLWLDNDDMRYYAAREATGLKPQPDLSKPKNLTALVISAERKLMAMDMQDLIFNGDKNYQSGQTDTKFYNILNGFVRQLSVTTNKKDLTTAEPTLADFAEVVANLPEKYKSNFAKDIKWFISQSTHDKIFKLLSARATSLGDGAIVDGKVTRLFGYDVEVVSGILGYLKTPGTISDGRIGIAILTSMSNLIPISTYTKAVEFKSVNNDTVSIKKGATYHNWKLNLDAVVKEVDAASILIGDKVM